LYLYIYIFLIVRSPVVQIMAAALSPCYLRLGGTAADRLIFAEHHVSKPNRTNKIPRDGGACANEGELCSKNISNFTMSGKYMLI
jgi:hypothetical protein